MTQCYVYRNAVPVQKEYIYEYVDPTHCSTKPLLTADKHGIKCSGSVVKWLGRWTWEQQVTGSTVGRRAVGQQPWTNRS